MLGFGAGAAWSQTFHGSEAGASLIFWLLLAPDFDAYGFHRGPNNGGSHICTRLSIFFNAPYTALDQNFIFLLPRISLQ